MRVFLSRSFLKQRLVRDGAGMCLGFFCWSAGYQEGLVREKVPPFRPSPPVFVGDLVVVKGVG